MKRCFWVLMLIGVLTGTSFAERIPGVDRVVVFKERRKLFLCKGDSSLVEYGISLGKNPKGHKLRRGDSRTPEGDYVLDWRNANSRFYRSIHISYPNEKDLKRASKKGVSPGGNIMIHGFPHGANRSIWSRYKFLNRDWTDGCIAVPNEVMDIIWASVKDGTPIEIHP